MTPAITTLDAAGVAYAVHEYEHDPANREFGREAADQMGLDPDRVFKTLVVTADGRPAVAIAPVSGRVAPKAVAAALRVKRVEMCDPSVAERVTGYVRGGISPFGQKRRLPTVIDEIATAFETVYVSGGRRGLDVEVATDDLIRLLDATVADITS